MYICINMQLCQLRGSTKRIVGITGISGAAFKTVAMAVSHSGLLLGFKCGELGL